MPEPTRLIVWGTLDMGGRAVCNIAFFRQSVIVISLDLCAARCIGMFLQLGLCRVGYNKNVPVPCGREVRRDVSRGQDPMECFPLTRV